MRWPASAEDAGLTTIPAPRPPRLRAIAAPMPLEEPSRADRGLPGLLAEVELRTGAELLGLISRVRQDTRPQRQAAAADA